MNNHGKPLLEIHEWKSEFQNLPLEDYILSFDDGLVSQYHALPFLKTLNTPKIFFISTDITRPEHQEASYEIIHCANAHEKAFQGDKENYMSWKEIQEIYNTDNCIIGGHSHYHHRYGYTPLKNLYTNLIDDTEKMIKEFNNQNIKIKDFCFPYNIDYNALYRGILIKEGIEDFYGSERIPIEGLK